MKTIETKPGCLIGFTEVPTGKVIAKISAITEEQAAVLLEIEGDRFKSLGGLSGSPIKALHSYVYKAGISHYEFNNYYIVLV